MSRTGLPKLLLLGVLLCTPQGVGAAPDHLVDTAHFRIRGRVDAAWVEQAGALLEGLYAALAEHFGTSPDRRRLPIEIRLHPDAAAFHAALKAEGVRAPGDHLGGYTVARSGRCHVVLQADRFHTHRLLLHEAVHGFHDRILRAGIRERLPFWYREGLAEYFGWHKPGTRGLVFGAMDAIARGHRPRQAQARAADPAQDPWRLIDGTARGDYTDALMVFRGLHDAKDERVRTLLTSWERDILRRGAGARTFARRATAQRADVVRVLRETWKQTQFAWAAETPGWRDVVGGIAVQPGAKPRRLRALAGAGRLATIVTLEPGRTGGAGLYVRSADGKRTWTLLADGSHVRLVRHDGGQSTEVASRPAGRNVALSLEAGPQGIVFGGRDRTPDGVPAAPFRFKPIKRPGPVPSPAVGPQTDGLAAGLYAEGRAAIFR